MHINIFIFLIGFTTFNTFYILVIKEYNSVSAWTYWRQRESHINKPQQQDDRLTIWLCHFVVEYMWPANGTTYNMIDSPDYTK